MTYATQAQIIASLPADLTADEAYAQLETIYGENLGKLTCDLTLELIRCLSTMAQSSIGLADMGIDTTLVEPENVKLYTVIAWVLDYTEQISLMRMIAALV